MVKDRLQELKDKHEEFEKDSVKKKRKKAEEEMEMCVKGFQTKVHAEEEKIKRLREDVAKIKKMQNTLYCSPFVSKTDLQAMESLGDQILTDSINIRKDIELLATQTVPESKKSPLISTSVQQRVHLVQIERLSDELRKLMGDFRTGQADYLDKTKARHRRQMQIVNNGDAGELDTSFENKDLFTGNIISDMQKAKGELQDLYEREKELHELEGQIVEVNKLFKDIHALVGEQGEMIDNIEANTQRAVVDVEEGNKQLDQAKENQRKARKKKICIIVLVLVILGILAGVIALIIANSSG